MRNLTNEERMEALRNAGIDTDKYDFSEVIILAPKADIVVEDKQVDNKKLFRRWVTAQTFRMLNSGSYNRQTRRAENGWDAYLRNSYAYGYQFKMMLDELKVLSKLELRDKESFDERSKFFTKEVVVGTCEDYFRQLDKYIKKNVETSKKVKGDDFKTTTFVTNMMYSPKDGKKIKLSDFTDKYVTKPREVVSEMSDAKSYAELHALLKLFDKLTIELPKDTPKCAEWRNTFKAIGAYETLKNLILFHDVVLKDCTNKAESMDKLIKCLDTYKGEYWKFHYMLKETIELNHFDLRESIRAHK